MHLPWLQTRLAVENRFKAMFELKASREVFCRAPLACLVAQVLLLTLALPLYLFKVELIPREAAWLPSLLFVVSMLPARLALGWAVARSRNAPGRRHGLIRLLSLAAVLPLVASYVLVVYFTQYLSWYGIASLYEQHAFMVPAPFMGL